MAYLRLLVNPADDTAFLRIINVPRRGNRSADGATHRWLSKQLGCSLLEACDSIHLKTLLNTQTFNAVDTFAQMIKNAAREAAHNDSAAVAVRTLLAEIGYDDWLFETSPSAKAAEMRVKNVYELHKWVSDMLAGNDEYEPISLEQAVAKLCLRDMMSRNEDDEQFDQVQ